MPLPTPNDGETDNEFISRCMGTQVMKDDYPDNQQRLAVCYSQLKKSNHQTPKSGLEMLDELIEKLK